MEILEWRDYQTHFTGDPGVAKSTHSLKNIDPESGKSKVKATLPSSQELALTIFGALHIYIISCAMPSRVASRE